MAMEETAEEAKVVCEEAPAEAEIYAYTSTTSSSAAPAMENGTVEARKNSMSELQSEPAEDILTAAPAEAPAAAESTPVFAFRMEVSAEASRFLEGFSPAAETAAEIHYHLSAEEFSTLQSQLEDAGILTIVEEGINADTDTTLVVLKR